MEVEGRSQEILDMELMYYAMCLLLQPCRTYSCHVCGRATVPCLPRVLWRSSSNSVLPFGAALPFPSSCVTEEKWNDCATKAVLKAISSPRQWWRWRWRSLQSPVFPLQDQVTPTHLAPRKVYWEGSQLSLSPKMTSLKVMPPLQRQPARHKQMQGYKGPAPCLHVGQPESMISAPQLPVASVETSPVFTVSLCPIFPLPLPCKYFNCGHSPIELLQEILSSSPFLWNQRKPAAIVMRRRKMRMIVGDGGPVTAVEKESRSYSIFIVLYTNK